MADEVAKLAPESQSYVEKYREEPPLDLTLPIEATRDAGAQAAQQNKGDYQFQGTREDLMVPSEDSNGSYEVPVTVLRPKAEQSSNIMVYFHGGGWSWGSRETHMSFCEMLAGECGCVVVNVEYRLSPEHKFPACYVDAKAVVEWCNGNKKMLANNDSAILGVAGDSCGGTISIVACQLTTCLKYQVLIYPVTTLSKSADYPSYKKYGEDLILTNALMTWFRNNLINDEDEREDPRCSPMNSTESDVATHPPALFIITECDLLADEGLAYEAKLKSAGVQTECVTLKGTIHGTVKLPGHYKEANKITIEAMRAFMAKI